MRLRLLWCVLVLLVIVAIVRMNKAPQPIKTTGLLLDNVPVQYVRPEPNGQQPIPPGWQRHEFNGGEYYVIPLANNFQPSVSR